MVQAAAAYQAYVREASAISAAFVDAAQIQSSLQRGASYEPKQFNRGAVAYGAIAGLGVMGLWLWLANMALMFGAELDAELVPMGSAGVKVMSVVRDVADAYVHAGGQYEWDQAAPVGVAQAAGLHCCRLDGSEIRFNNEDTFIPDILICRPELKDEILEHAQAFAEEHGGF